MYVDNRSYLGLAMRASTCYDISFYQAILASFANYIEVILLG